MLEYQQIKNLLDCWFVTVMGNTFLFILEQWFFISFLLSG